MHRLQGDPSLQQQQQQPPQSSSSQQSQISMPTKKLGSLVKGSVAASQSMSAITANRERERDYWMERSNSYSIGSNAGNGGGGGNGGSAGAMGITPNGGNGASLGVGNYIADTARMDPKKLLQHAQSISFGYYVPQDSSYNPILPVLPRFGL